MKNKGLLIALLALVVLVAGYFVWKVGSHKTESKKDIVNIGCIYPLTGNGAQYGEYFKMGTELAHKHAIKQGVIEEEEINFIYEDGKGLATESINAFNKLVSTNNISGCLTDLSSVLVPIKPVINQNKITTINSSSFSSDIEDGDDYMFSILPNADSYAKQIAEYAYNSLGKRKAAIVYRNDDMGTSFEKIFSNVFQNLGGTIVFKEGHEKGQSDYNVITQKLRALGEVDIVFCASYGVEVANLLKQAKEDNFQNTFITFQGFIIPDVFEVAGVATNGVYVLGSGFTNLDNSVIDDISIISKELFDIESINFYTAAHYDAAMMLIEAIAKGNKTGSEIRNLFDSKSYSYEGITGNIKFNENGLADMKLVPFRVKDGEFILIN